MLKPSDCVYEDFSSGWYKKWGKIIDFPNVAHAKFWEIAAIAEALDNRRMLRAGKRGLGFGVGTEELVSTFASRNVDVVATDQNPEDAKAKQWDNGQLARGKRSLYFPKIIDKETFDARVTYRPYDMNNAEPDFYDGFDFCWSNCVIGHLGSIEKSMRFIERHAKYIKKGGYSVLTTELNISSLDTTISEKSDTVVFLLSHLYEMFERAAKVGLEPDRLKLRFGSTPQDLSINFDSTRLHRQGFKNVLKATDDSTAFIKIPFSNFVVTQILLVFKKTGRKGMTQLQKVQHRWDQETNKRKLLKHVGRNELLSDYYVTYPPNVRELTKLQPTTSSLEVRMKPGETRTLALTFKNKSPFVFSDLSENHPFNLPTLAVATTSPINRTSVFRSKSWFSDNRPSVEFKAVKAGPGHVYAPHRLTPSGTLTYDLELHAPKSSGTYQESFCLVAEGCSDFDDSSRVDITITVK